MRKPGQKVQDNGKGRMIDPEEKELEPAEDGVDQVGTSP